MLVLERGVNQSIIIGGDIEVMVCSIRDGKVRLGIEAPGSVEVDRKEIHLRKYPSVRDVARG